MYRHHEENMGPRRGRGRRGDFGPWGPGGGGPRGGGLGGPGGRRGRARRGNVKAALLALLAERPMHGYEMISELENRTGGIWRPSPGSVYPTLQLLEEEGLVTSAEQEGKRLFTITEQGATTAAADPEPWRAVADAAGDSAVKARESVHQLAVALKQVMMAGTEEQQARSLEIVGDAKRKLYGILAES
ncbi:DNA-binding PadR family transcriptional regulator [Actinocorallia herbida]|uniref:DNA-binding PadR family transcriptional regulator n=1 Tax=Actinocorallia herbida TaxID=58109 RepID=A0A3N1D9M3_9ACTN|nr:PadR family transcriptional regulator [Actinocorallia herbida]ROO90224.1 DNA-binding PadR family transcriptional regulator [Actinocorallia herbida]